MAMEYRNLMEDIVMQNLDGLMQARGICTCDACRSDVAAYALNQLPPRYVATHRGKLLSKLSSYELQFKTDVIAAISEGILVVGSSPRHQDR